MLGLAIWIDEENHSALVFVEKLAQIMVVRDCLEIFGQMPEVGDQVVLSLYADGRSGEAQLTGIWPKITPVLKVGNCNRNQPDAA